MNTLYALLVGIDAYREPDTPLKGCLKDVESIEEFILDHCAGQFKIEIEKLLDEQATYSGIINTFRSHLGQASPDDTVWFHFSGHGTEEWTASEFAPYDPNSLDQTLLCYDSGHGAENLADKELAVLLHEVAHSNGPGNAPHILVTLDCCHSGSGTRTGGDKPEYSPRGARSRNTRRPLSSYIDGYYTNLPGQLTVPISPHINLSACKTFQIAGDGKSGGAFTSGLIDALKKSRGDISYVDLYTHARHAVARIRDNQTPQFATIDNFDPYTRFLRNEQMGTPELYDVSKVSDDGWVIHCGVIHGLPAEPPSPLEVDILSPAPELKSVGSATIKRVGTSKSTINLESNLDLKGFFGSLVGDTPEYRARLKSITSPPMSIFVTNHEKLPAELQTAISDARYITLNDARDSATSIELKVMDDHIRMTDTEFNRSARLGIEQDD